jgi:hypothetical protein
VEIRRQEQREHKHCHCQAVLQYASDPPVPADIWQRHATTRRRADVIRCDTDSTQSRRQNNATSADAGVIGLLCRFVAIFGVLFFPDVGVPLFRRKEDSLAGVVLLFAGVTFITFFNDAFFGAVFFKITFFNTLFFTSDGFFA